MNTPLKAYFLFAGIAASLLVGFASPAHAAMADASRLVTLQTDGADSNYVQPYDVTTGVPHNTGLAAFTSFMAVVGFMVTILVVILLLYAVFLAIEAHANKNHIRMHSYGVLRRHHR